MVNEHFFLKMYGHWWVHLELELKITPKANVVLIIFHLGKVPAKKKYKNKKEKVLCFFFVLSDKVGMRW